MSVGQTLHFSCACGELTGRLVDISARDGRHIVCHCNDCRVNLVALGHSDPGAEGVDLFQTTPDKIKIDKGGENLALLRLSGKGLMRWYAKCCSTPLFNTTTKRGLPMVGISAKTIDEYSALGPVTSRAYKKQPDGKVTHENAGPLITSMMARMGKAWIDGSWRDTPFFDDTGTPVRDARVLSREERAAAFMGLSR
jgi:hypothetical protein